MTSTKQLSSLPNEVQHKVFNYLTFDERLCCSRVCSSWRSLLLNWSTMWERMSTDDGHNIASDLLVYENYIKGSDVKYLYWNSRRAPAFSEISQLIYFLSEREWNHIEHAEFIVYSTNEQIFLDFMGICGNSLTSIVLHVVRNSTEFIAPHHFLLHCPNLRKLHFASPTWEETPTLGDFQHQNLIDLGLLVIYQNSAIDVVSFLRSTPNIQRLFLDFKDFAGIIPSLPSFLRQHCPSIARFYLDDANSAIPVVKDIDWQPQHTPAGGLIELTMGRLLGPYRKIDVAKQFIEESHEYLKVLGLINTGTLPVEIISFLSRFEFPCLTHLDLSWISCETPHALCTFLECSVPNLVSLTLKITSFPESDMLLDTIASNLKYLERLYFRAFLWDASIFDALPRFLDVMAGRSLKAIGFCGIPTVTAQVLNVVANRYPAIEEFTIKGCYNISAEEILTFLNCWSLERRVNKLQIFIRNWDHTDDDFYPDRNAVMQFLEAMDKVAKKWTLNTRFPQMWEGFLDKDYVEDTVSHVTYRAYMRLNTI